MCKLQHEDPIAPSTMGGVPSTLGADPNDTGAPSTAGMAAGPTGTVSRPTKFAKLLKVAMPLIEGGAVGASSDWRVPGGGEEAGQFFNQQTQIAMQRHQMALQDEQLRRQIQDDQYRNMLEYARTQHELNAPPTGGAGRQYQKDVVNAQGQRETHTFHREWDAPSSSYVEVDDGLAPDTSKMQFLPGQEGYVGVRTSGPQAGSVAPVMQPSSTGKKGPQLPNPSGMLPTTPPEAKPVMPRSTPRSVAQGSELIDPATGRVVAKGAPKTATPRQPPQESPNTAMNNRAETFAQHVLDGTKGDVNAAIQAVERSTVDADTKGAIIKNLRSRLPKPSNKRNWLDDPAVRAILQPSG